MKRIIYIFPAVIAALFARPTLSQEPFLSGVDISFVDQLEEAGVRFTDEGVVRDVFDILSSYGINAVRLRLRHSPEGGVNGLDRTVAMARRAKQAGMGLLLNIHFSDTWADPGHQTKPAAWARADFPALVDSVARYSERVLTAFVDQNIVPDIVQVGNEITTGMLWDDGRVGGAFDTPEQWQRLVTLIEAAIDGIGIATNGVTRPDIMIHIDRGGDADGATWFFDNLFARGAKADLIGISYYPWWHGDLTAFQQTLDALSAGYNQGIVVVETAYPWTLDSFDNTHNIVGLPEQLLASFPATARGQRDFISEIVRRVDRLPAGRARGVFYWAPEWIAVSGLGSSWENLTLFDPTGNALVSLAALDPKSVVATESVQPAETPMSLVIYPNPAADVIHVRYAVDHDRAVRFRIYDVLGRERIQTEAIVSFGGAEREISVDLGDLECGMYFVRLFDSQHAVSPAAFVRVE